MSRCFPYPPPGYVKGSGFTDALIKPVKTETEKEKTKLEMKEHKRREKEVRRKESKEKKREKRKLESIRGIDGANKRRRDADGSYKLSDKCSIDLQMKSKLEAEQLERSSLTEEHGHAILSQSPCYSSDGTQSKTKKCRIEQTPVNESRTTHGKVIRFKLKRREPEQAPPTDDMPSTSGRTDTPVPKIFEAPQLTNPLIGAASVPLLVNLTKESSIRPLEQLSLNLIPAAKGSDTLPSCSSAAKEPQNPISEYVSLLRDWIPPPIHLDWVEGSADDQWLFSCKKQAAIGRGSLKAYDGAGGHRSNLLCPRAVLVPEVDVHVLPYTVPF